MFVYLFENKGFVRWIFYFTVANYRPVCIRMVGYFVTCTCLYDVNRYLILHCNTIL